MLQREICDEDCSGGLLADDCGCGKTYMTTCVIAGNSLPSTLIISPVSTLHQWREILSSFGRMNPLIATQECGRMQTVPEGTRVVLTTYSVFAPKRKGSHVPKLFTNHTWDRIILDEGHLIKNRNGVTFANIDKLRAIIRWVLTATPVQNSMKDVATLAKWIRWPGGLDDFLKIKMLRRSLKGEGARNPRLRLPSLMSEVVRLQFELMQERDVYNTVKELYKTRIEHTESGCKLYTEALQGILRCRQACCHPALLDGGGSSRKRKGGVNSSTKFSYICADIAANLREKSIIFCMWTLEISLMLECLGERGINALKFDGSMTKEQRETTLYNFRNTSGIHALVIQIQAGGIGLNLQCATRVYITSPTWNPTHELQAICRSHRLGQEQVVKCFRLIIEDTIEERMMEIQNRKLALISDALGDRDMLEKMSVGESIDIADIRALFV
jgi:SNF2 family DNA or RNA helicase